MKCDALFRAAALATLTEKLARRVRAYGFRFGSALVGPFTTLSVLFQTAKLREGNMHPKSILFHDVANLLHQDVSKIKSCILWPIFVFYY